MAEGVSATHIRPQARRIIAIARNCAQSRSTINSSICTSANAVAKELKIDGPRCIDECVIASILSGAMDLAVFIVTHNRLTAALGFTFADDLLETFNSANHNDPNDDSNNNNKGPHALVLFV
mmetsp:Transcript_6496/g.9871  ORF Transcript_6496/g.9871 Transcript_6496/m.9871 type:complete len:122 (-) Transcript_6496:34-399(-)